MRICIIHHPDRVSGAEIRSILAEFAGEYDYELRAASPERDTRALARMAVDESFDRLVVAGGDGTIWQVVQGLAPDFAIELAVLPFGTGNDLARSLGLNPELLVLAAEYAFSGRVEPIDLIRIEDDRVRYCTNIANGGFGGRVAADVRAVDKQRWGNFAYWMSSIQEMIHPHEFSVDLEIDENSHVHTTTSGVAVANGRFVGGGFPIAPNAKLNDGQLDVVVLPVLDTIELMSLGLGFTMGDEYLDDSVRSFRCRKVRIQSNPPMPFSVDGESDSCADMLFELLPLALKVVVGDFPAAFSDSATPFLI